MKESEYFLYSTVIISLVVFANASITITVDHTWGLLEYSTQYTFDSVVSVKPEWTKLNLVMFLNLTIITVD